MDLKAKLFAHQQEAIDDIKSRPYHAIIHQCGLGKTLTALGIINERVNKLPTYRTLVVVPNTLIDNWLGEVSKFTSLTAIAVVGSRVKRSMLLSSPAHIYLINYEGLRIIADELVARRFNLVIFDESQCLKCHTSQQSKAGFRVAMSCPHRIIMTGTPIMNTPLDVFAQYRCLSPDIFGVSYYRFRAMYAVMGGYLGKQVMKYINTDRLKRIVESHSSIRTKEECLDLPPKLYQTVKVDLLPEQLRMYKQLKEQFITACQESVVTAPVILTRLVRFSQITAGFYKDITGKETSYGTNPKHEWLIEWLKETGQKTIVFVRFIKELRDLEDSLKRNNIGYVSVHGAVRDRIELVKRFNSEASIQVFIGQIDTAGQGINLQAASYCVFLSNNYSYGDREQAESRIHRAGQLAKSCTYIDVVARNTIDEQVLKILGKKQSLAGLLVKDIVRMI